MSYTATLLTEDPREANLPRWSREILEELRRQIGFRDRNLSATDSRVSDLEQQVRELQSENGPADSTIFMDREDPETGDLVKPLGLGKGTVWFKVSQKQVHVGVDADGHLSIWTDAPCAVIPRTTTMVQIMLR